MTRAMATHAPLADCPRRACGARRHRCARDGWRTAAFRGSDSPHDASELTVNPKVVVFGEDVGRKGGVHLVTEGLQKQFGADRVFDTSLSEEAIVGAPSASRSADSCRSRKSSSGSTPIRRTSS